MSDELRIVGPYFSSSGYSKFTRAALRTALLAGYKVQAVEANYKNIQIGYEGKIKYKRRYETENKKRPIPDVQRFEVETALKTKVSPEAPTLMIQLPWSMDGWHEFSQGPRLAWTMIESDRVPEVWAKWMYSADMLLAPSRYVWNTFKRDVPEMALELLPLPVDDRIYNTEQGDHLVTGTMPKFLFLSVFNCRERKHWRMMMQAFMEEFGPDEDVGLVVKPDRMGDVAEMADWINEQARRKARQVYVLGKWMSDESLNAWYQKCDCYVLPSCEGFGLPFVEAALCGKPSIALDMGGSWDVVTGETGWRIRANMDVVYGNLPHVYDSSHRFAVPEDLLAIQHAMRLAYNSNEDKGSVARRKALEQFTPQALAEPLRKVVSKAEQAFKKRTWMWKSPDFYHKAPQWGLCVGDGYGDAIAVLGNCQEVLRGSPGATIKILHYGFNKGLKEFLELQPIIDEVRQIIPPDKETQAETANEVGAYYAYPASKWLPSLLKGTGIKPDEVALTQVHWPWGTWPVHRPGNIRLTDESERWAEEQRQELGEFILVQPFSTNSVDIQSHWPHWMRFLKWLLSATETTHRLVFCGLNPIPGLRGENVVDLIGKTPSMMHVFALADRAKGVITTCNALGVWTACRGIPALVAANQAIPLKSSFWYRYQSTPNNTMMPLDTSADRFQKAAVRFLGRLSK